MSNIGIHISDNFDETITLPTKNGISPQSHRKRTPLLAIASRSAQDKPNENVPTKDK